MAKFIIWSILITIVIRMAWRFVHSILEGAGLLEGSSPPASTTLVRDPVCGVFVVPGQALTAGSGESTKYFCSEKCRKAWSGK